MLINVEKMRLLKNDSPEMKYSLIKTNIERFFRDYIYYYNVYDGKELIIDSGYLPYHYLDNSVIEKIVTLLEDELGYSVIVVKTTNTSKQGYQKGDLINIRLFDKNQATAKEVDDYFNLKMFQPLYSSFHSFNNINGDGKFESSYMSCINNFNDFLLDDSIVENKNLGETNEKI
ncbi:MAG: hypothetical protein PHP54_02165 [Clostridia bacterium]|nr:hypothetical protein [Clostridia bacterium]